MIELEIEINLLNLTNHSASIYLQNGENKLGEIAVYFNLQLESKLPPKTFC